MKSIVFSILTVCLLSCKTNSQSNNSTHSQLGIAFLDSISSTKAIVAGDIDGFYDQISQADISIQMKKASLYSTREEAVDSYKDFIKTQVESFTKEEEAYMRRIFTEVNKRLSALNPELIIPDIQLIKIKLDHYGPDVYYTRGNAIAIPKNTLSRTDTIGQTNVMLHEVWHILSRNNKELRDAAYAKIGFSRHNRSVTMHSSLADMVLTNPDGVTMDYAIDLEDGIEAIPIIKSKRSVFDPSIPSFFDYLDFDLYEIADNGQIRANADGSTTIPAKNNAIFFNKIKDNTQYIIHPDEITADNFMLAVNANYTNEYDKFSPEGKALVNEFIDILKTFSR